MLWILSAICQLRVKKGGREAVSLGLLQPLLQVEGTKLVFKARYALERNRFYCDFSKEQIPPYPCP